MLLNLEEFRKATFINLTDAICGLIIVITSQFMDFDFSNWESNGKSIVNKGEFQPTIGKYFTVKYPDNWPNDEKYDFIFGNLQKNSIKVMQFDYQNTPYGK